MAENKGLKIPILELRSQGKSYREIENILKCARSTIHYHCNKQGLNDTGKKRYALNENTQMAISKFCKHNKTTVAQVHFNLSKSSIFKYKNFQLNKDEKK